jgi:hypothetical protein
MRTRGGNGLPQAGKKLPPLPPAPAKARFSADCRAFLRHPRKLARLLLITGWITRRRRHQASERRVKAKL